MRICFIVPAPFSTVSGGYAHDRRMMVGLHAAGHGVAIVELAGRHPLADDMARAAASELWDALPRDARPVIDGLALPAFRARADELADRGAIGLIHHLTSLETGQSDHDRALLRYAEHFLMPRLAGRHRHQRTHSQPPRRRFWRHARAHRRGGARYRRPVALHGLGRAVVPHPIGRHAGAAQGT
jgi:hypothetical protein